jgi:hypothetical protein
MAPYLRASAGANMSFDFFPILTKRLKSFQKQLVLSLRPPPIKLDAGWLVFFLWKSIKVYSLIFNLIADRFREFFLGFNFPLFDRLDFLRLQK